MASRGRRPAAGRRAVVANTSRTPRTIRAASAVVPGKKPPDSKESQMTRPAAPAPMAVAAAPSPRGIHNCRREALASGVGSWEAGFSAGGDAPMSTDSDISGRTFPFWAACKRLIDLAGAGFGLLLLSPLFLVVAIAVRLDSRGPVFFRQERLGQEQTPFRVWKFRPMQTGASDAMHRQYIADLAAGTAPSEGLKKLTADPRVT